MASSALPDAPVPDAPAAAPEGAKTSTSNPAVIAGTVLDTNQSEVEGAQVALTRANGTKVAVRESGTNGQFTFPGLSPGTYRVTVTGPGMGTYVSPNLTVRAGDFHFVPRIVLPVATATSEVTVVGDKEELAEEQVQIAIQQRVLGVFPNFYSSYDWNAPPMETKQKFQLALRSATDPVAFAEAGAIAGYEQYANVFPGYGSGAAGYAKRYAAAYASSVSGRMLGNAVFASIFHQDPRYFYMGSGTFRKRALYAIEATFITRGDNGRWEPNYSHLLGNFAGGALSNLYYPAADRGPGLCFINGAIDTAGNAGANLLREFVLKGFTSKVPSYANGKP